MTYFTEQDLIDAYAAADIDVRCSRYLPLEVARANQIAADRGIEFANHCVRCWVQTESAGINADAYYANQN